MLPVFLPHHFHLYYFEQGEFSWLPRSSGTVPVPRRRFPQLTGKDSQVNMIGENPEVQADGICKLSAWITVLGIPRQEAGKLEEFLSELLIGCAGLWGNPGQIPEHRHRC